MSMLVHWQQSLRFCMPSSWEGCVNLIKRVYSMWWQKGGWFVLGVIAVSMFQLDALLLNLSDSLVMGIWWAGALSWLLALFTLYLAVAEVLFGKPRITWFGYTVFFVISLIVRTTLVLVSHIFDPVLGLLSFLGSLFSFVLYALLAPFGITDVFALTNAEFALPFVGRFELDCAALFVFFMLSMMSGMCTVRHIGSSWLRALQGTFMCYPAALCMFYAATFFIVATDRIIGLLAFLIAVPMQSAWVPGLISLLFLILVRWVGYIPWGLLVLPIILTLLGMLFKRCTLQRIKGVS